jgi:hypothetical protein
VSCLSNPGLKLMDAMAAAPEDGLHGRLYSERHGSDDGIFRWLRGWRGAGGQEAQDPRVDGALAKTSPHIAFERCDSGIVGGPNYRHRCEGFSRRKLSVSAPTTTMLRAS